MNKEVFIEELKKINIDINKDQLNKLETYYKFLVEYNRMKKMNNVIYRDKIQRCYKTQNSIASELCACVENLLSSMDMYSPSSNWETPTGDDKIDKPKVKQEKKKNEKIVKNFISY